MNMSVGVLYTLQEDENGFYLEEYLSDKENKKFYIHEMDFDMTDKAQINIVFELGVLCGKGLFGTKLYIDEKHRLGYYAVKDDLERNEVLKNVIERNYHQYKRSRYYTR